ncbi:group III truncated hemoglobin [Rasiella rasia]|uniref:group III truncated hemoglobin n=1 Tax=Rasiella rasia TaxID=2744027 RepID=UPI00298278C7|nr:group III truncated hemoglobin [Rasiella rasia]
MLARKDITTREDVYLLVSTFYGKVQNNELLGPIFNRAITDWDTHFEHLTDFWETNLFFKRKFKGNPIQKHVEVDTAEGHSINELHFGVWLNMWFETVDDLFVGELAQIAKNRARNMGTFIHLQIFNARKNNATDSIK